MFFSLSLQPSVTSEKTLGKKETPTYPTHLTGIQPKPNHPKKKKKKKKRGPSTKGSPNKSKPMFFGSFRHAWIASKMVLVYSVHFFWSFWFESNTETIENKKGEKLKKFWPLENLENLFCAHFSKRKWKMVWKKNTINRGKNKQPKVD